MKFDMTYCLPRDRHKDLDICKSCLRNRLHKRNQHELNGKIVDVVTMTPSESEVHGYHCDLYVEERVNGK